MGEALSPLPQGGGQPQGTLQESGETLGAARLMFAPEVDSEGQGVFPCSRES